VSMVGPPANCSNPTWSLRTNRIDSKSHSSTRPEFEFISSIRLDPIWR
jgi:hypothetical protein